MQRRSIILATTILLVSQSTFAQTPAAKVVDYLKPALDTQTIAILNIDLARFDIDQLANQFSQHVSVPAQVNLFHQLVGSYDSALGKLNDAGVTEVNFIFKLGPLNSSNRLVVLKCDNDDRSLNVIDALTRFEGLFGVKADIRRNGDLVFIGTREHHELEWAKYAADPPSWYLRHEQTELNSLKTALAGAGNAPIRMGLAITSDQKRALLEMSPNSFAADGPASIQNLKWVSLGLDSLARKIEIQLETSTEESAATMAEKISNSLSAFAEIPSLQNNLPSLSEWFASIKMTNTGNSVAIKLAGDKYMAATKGLSAFVFQALNRQRYSQSIAKLRQIVIALHNYHDANGKFPPAYTTDQDGNPLHSWRVLILPYLGQNNLYEKFKLDEPWNSKHNQDATEFIPKAYFSNIPGNGTGFQTRFVAPFGKTALSKDGMKLSDIGDGASNTIAVMEVAPEHSIRWTQPDEFEIDQDNLLDALVEESAVGFWAGFCDASVRFIPNDIEPETLKQIMLANDGSDVTLKGTAIQLPLGNEPATPRPDPNYDALNELPAFWFNELLQSPQIISGLSGG